MDEKIVKDSQGLTKDLVNDYISRRQAVYVCLELMHERRKWLSDAGQKEISGIDAAMCAIQDLPSAQPERKRGQWIPNIYPDVGDGYRCSQCGAYHVVPYKFCHNCGADMREVDDE